MPDHVVHSDVGFPSPGLHVLSAMIHMLGTSILAHCLSRRLAQTDLSSWRAVTRLTWPRVCMLLIFLDSWLFLFTSGLLVLGIGLETNERVCTSAIAMCIAFYVTSKVFIYFFLIEKIHIVWQPCPGSKRFSSRIFTICFFTVCLYMVVVTIMALGKIHHIRPDGKCMIGLRPFSSIPLLSYDLFVNLLFTALFVWPLLRFNFANSFVRGVARRTMVAAAVALTTSTVNVAVLTLVGGAEWGWICLGSCGIDVIVNALALFYATSAGTVVNDKSISFRFPEFHITNAEAPPPIVPPSLTVPTAAYSLSTDCTSLHKPMLPMKSLIGSQTSEHAVQVNISNQEHRLTGVVYPDKEVESLQRSSDDGRSESWV